MRVSEKAIPSRPRRELAASDEQPVRGRDGINLILDCADVPEPLCALSLNRFLRCDPDGILERGRYRLPSGALALSILSGAPTNAQRPFFCPALSRYRSATPWRRNDHSGKALVGRMTADIRLSGHSLPDRPLVSVGSRSESCIASAANSGSLGVRSTLVCGCRSRPQTS